MGHMSKRDETNQDAQKGHFSSDRLATTAAFCYRKVLGAVLYTMSTYTDTEKEIVYENILR